MKKIILEAKVDTKSSNLNVILDGAIPLGIMNNEQYGRYKRYETTGGTLTTALELFDGDVKLDLIYAFNHPISKAKFLLVYNSKAKELYLVGDVTLNVKMGIRKFDIVGYAIGAASEEVKYENVNFKKTIDTSFKINLDTTKFDNLRNNIKVALLNIPGAEYANNAGRGYGNYGTGGDYLENNTYPQAILKIDFTDEILDETLPVNILTSYNLTSDKIISNNYVSKADIQENIVFLVL